jgi:hypothetical protein
LEIYVMSMISPPTAKIKAKTPYRYALDLARRGLACFPMTKAKTPLAGSRGVHDATTDALELAKLFAHPRAELVAVACGKPSGVSVLDVDRQHDGLRWYEANQHRMQETFAYRTRSGGLHLWFRHHPELRTVGIGQIAHGIEIRATGASAIYWPSIGLPILCDALPAPWPDWLTPPPKPAWEPPEWRSDNEPRPPEHIEAALAGLVRNVATAGQGERNARLHWSACRAAAMSARGEISRRNAEAVLIEAASRCGLDHREAAATIASAYKGGR